MPFGFSRLRLSKLRFVHVFKMLPLFLSETRLYELVWPDGAGPEMPVEAWWGREALSSGFELCIDLLSTDAHPELKRFLGRAVRLDSRLSDGGKASRTVLVRAAQKLGADGGFARYRVTIVPWIWLLGRGRHNRVFQDKTVVQIIETVFGDYADIAAWQWSDEVAGFLADARPRSYCVQYGESDYTFVSRLLADTGAALHDLLPDYDLLTEAIDLPAVLDELDANTVNYSLLLAAYAANQRRHPVLYVSSRDPGGRQRPR